ncbi:uncharacterized protein [Nicotiana sylvestris]|uniref:uncharacterized protein n=1 Tax=Nicotiana sylvestris TaxID=4096 RepID=UPI00388C3A91
MKDRESAKEMFSGFSKILGDLKYFGRTIKSREQVRKILRSLPTIWQPKVIALECQDLDKMSYDELRGDLIAFEKTHLDRQIQQEKKKIAAFKANVDEPEDKEEEEGGEHDENIAMLSQVVTSMMKKNINSRKGKPNFRKGRTNNENDGRYYECRKHRLIQADCLGTSKGGSLLEPEVMKKKDDSNEESGERGFSGNRRANDEEDSGQLGLMADEGTSEVRPRTCPNCYELQEFVDIALADIERVLNELRKIQREKKDWALKLEFCEIKRDMLQEEFNELQLQLNGLKKSTSHSSVKSNQTVHQKQKKSHECSFCGKNGHNTNQCRNRIKANKDSENSNSPSYFYCGKRDHTSNHCRLKYNRRREHRMKNRKGKWYLNSVCSRHMTGFKQLFKTVTKLDGGTVTFGDKSKGNVIGVGKVHLSSTCDVDEVYLVDELS